MLWILKEKKIEFERIEGRVWKDSQGKENEITQSITCFLLRSTFNLVCFMTSLHHLIPFSLTVWISYHTFRARKESDFWINPWFFLLFKILGIRKRDLSLSIQIKKTFILSIFLFFHSISLFFIHSVLSTLNFILLSLSLSLNFILSLSLFLPFHSLQKVSQHVSSSYFLFVDNNKLWIFLMNLMCVSMSKSFWLLLSTLLSLLLSLPHLSFSPYLTFFLSVSPYLTFFHTHFLSSFMNLFYLAINFVLMKQELN